MVVELRLKRNCVAEEKKMSDKLRHYADSWGLEATTALTLALGYFKILSLQQCTGIVKVVVALLV